MSALFQAGQKAGLTNVVQLRSERVFSTFPIGAKRNNTLGIEFHEGRFHTTILSGLFQAGQKAGLTNVVQLRSKRVFSTFPIGAKRKNTLGIEFHEVGFIPPFRVGFSKQGKKPGMKPNVVQLRSKRVLSTFPIGAKQKNTLRIEYHEVGFILPILSALFQAGQKAGLTNVVQLRSERVFFRLSPSGQNETTPLGSNSTRSVSYHHFEWAFPSRAKSRVDERRPIAFKTRFFDFPHRGETKKHPWDRIPRGRFHTIILSGLFQAGQKAGLTNVVQLRSKRVFSTFPIGAKRNNTLGIEFPRGRFHTTILSGLFQAGQKAGLTNVVQLR